MRNLSRGGFKWTHLSFALLTEPMFLNIMIMQRALQREQSEVMNMRSRSADFKNRICDVVNDWKRNVGRTPSLKEIGDELGVNKSTIYRYLVEMDEEGLLEYDGNSIDTKELNHRTMNTARAAIVGSIPCGEAQAEDEYVEEYVNLPTNLFGKGDFYILRAKGNSMEDAGISEGDLVVILKQSTAEIGDIVVALDDQNQNTLKRFAGFDEDNKVVLEYMNEDVYPGKAILVKELTVQGVAKHVIKSL